MVLQAATTPVSFQAADTAAPTAGAQGPSAAAYQGSTMQAQANTQTQADYQGSSSQQAPTFGLVGPDSFAAPADRPQEGLSPGNGSEDSPATPVNSMSGARSRAAALQ